MGFEPTVGYKPTPIFKTGALNQLDHLSKCIAYCGNSIYINTYAYILSIEKNIFLLDIFSIFFYLINPNILSKSSFVAYSIIIFPFLGPASTLTFVPKKTSKRIFNISINSFIFIIFFSHFFPCFHLFLCFSNTISRLYHIFSHIKLFFWVFHS